MEVKKFVFECPLCGKRLSANDPEVLATELINHLRMVHGTDKAKCPVCGAELGPSELWEHARGWGLFKSIEAAFRVCIEAARAGFGSKSKKDKCREVVASYILIYSNGEQEEQQ
jgi:predicted RNA-binding Zn-ribbon protein involved in translation (DUF1610 family)